MTRKPALTLLHLGPGFANGIANLHNARRARSPIVNLIGDHASWHLRLRRAAHLGHRVARETRCRAGCAAARRRRSWRATAPRRSARRSTPPGQVATLIVPQDCAWGAAEGPARMAPPPSPAPVADAAIAAAAAALSAGEPARALPRRRGARRDGAARGGAHRRGDRLPRCFTRPSSRGSSAAATCPRFARLPYFPEQAREALCAAAVSSCVAGTREPVGFFGYPDGRSRLAPDDARKLVLASPATTSRRARGAGRALGAPAPRERRADARAAGAPDRSARPGAPRSGDRRAPARGRDRGRRGGDQRARLLRRSPPLRRATACWR